MLQLFIDYVDENIGRNYEKNRSTWLKEKEAESAGDTESVAESAGDSAFVAEVLPAA